MIVFSLPFPVSLNQAYRAVNRGKHATVLISKKGRDYKKLVANLMGNRYQIITDDICMEIHAYEPDRRRRDCDNFPKLIQDALTGIVYKDDCQIKRLIVEKKGLNKEEPHVKIYIHKYLTDS